MTTYQMAVNAYIKALLFAQKVAFAIALLPEALYIALAITISTGFTPMSAALWLGVGILMGYGFYQSNKPLAPTDTAEGDSDQTIEQ